MARNVAIQVLRGPISVMPMLDDGEFYFATDQAQLYVGLGGSSLPIGGPMGVIIQDPVTPSQQAHVDALGNLQVAGNLSISAAGKTVVQRSGSLTTTAVGGFTILTYTVTAGKTLFLEYIDIQARLTVLSAVASILGLSSVIIGAGTAYTASFVNPTTSDAGSQAIRITFSEAIPIPAGTIITFSAGTAAATSMLWIANFGGYEK